MKTCTRCETEKELTEFRKDSKRPDGLQIYCKACAKHFDDQRYGRHSERHKDVVRARKKRVREFVVNYLLEHPCVDCGEDDPVVLDFDHLSDKTKNVATMVQDGCSNETLMREISKCEVRCSNCHRRITARRDSNHWSHTVLPALTN